MKRLLFILVTGISLLSYGQDNLYGKQKIFKVSVAHKTSIISWGYLADIEDSVICLTPSASSIYYNAVVKKDLEKIHYSNIEQVTIKRKGSVGRGILFGALIGLSTGAITGLIMGDDPPCIADPQNPFYGFCEAFRWTAGDKAIVLGGAGAVGGSIIGGIIGAVARKRFVIGGKKDKFDNMKLSVLDRMYGISRK